MWSDVLSENSHVNLYCTLLGRPPWVYLSGQVVFLSRFRAPRRRRPRSALIMAWRGSGVGPATAPPPPHGGDCEGGEPIYVGANNRP